MSNEADLFVMSSEEAKGVRNWARDKAKETKDNNVFLPHSRWNGETFAKMRFFLDAAESTINQQTR